MKRMNPYQDIMGVRFMLNPCLVVNRRVETRVLGGYMNRWLIREVKEVIKPDPNLYWVAMLSCYVAHPETIKRLEVDMANRYAKAEDQAAARAMRGY